MRKERKEKGVGMRFFFMKWEECLEITFSIVSH